MENNEENQQKEEVVKPSSFFSISNKTNISQNSRRGYSKSEINRISVFKHIEKTQPTNIYKVAKELGLAYNTCSYIIRDLIFAGVVSEKMWYIYLDQLCERNLLTTELKDNITILSDGKERVGRKVTHFKVPETSSFNLPCYSELITINTIVTKDTKDTIVTKDTKDTIVTKDTHQL